MMKECEKLKIEIPSVKFVELRNALKDKKPLKDALAFGTIPKHTPWIYPF